MNRLPRERVLRLERDGRTSPGLCADAGRGSKSRGRSLAFRRVRGSQLKQTNKTREATGAQNTFNFPDRNFLSNAISDFHSVHFLPIDELTEFMLASPRLKN